MFDMSWGEVMLIGGVALIVIGPKDLPKALRTVGQITGKMRRMAGEFQSQFNEAIREAEFEEIRREVDGVKKSAGTMGPVFNPVQTIRDEIRGAVDGRPETKTTPSPTQPLANVAAQLAERDPVAPPESVADLSAETAAEIGVEPPAVVHPSAHDYEATTADVAGHGIPPVEALPDLPPRPKPVPSEPLPIEPTPSSADPLAPAVASPVKTQSEPGR
ncbi:twin-arginine translocase subunit TatB [Methylobacterium sp. BTF04]|uniref:Sec-independent protein translocase protein TatB n=1 Tax=Methylobacterium sp. BTF04 TaxID=2708300 RepID=UPI0013D85CEF|nr:Sec-independent protein translocase protein TatB [Methylobacterium sp. BTF04]NEU11321.1 twin-arginine translocase subunit TatB [Methylobacterium sp. BTF04]